MTPEERDAWYKQAGAGGNGQRPEELPIQVRPSIQLLKRLAEPFVLGIYSSASLATVGRGISQIQQQILAAEYAAAAGGASGMDATGAPAAAPSGSSSSGQGGSDDKQQAAEAPLASELPPAQPAQPQLQFEVVKHRRDCRPDPHWHLRPGGKAHHTIKPLAQRGFDITR